MGGDTRTGITSEVAETLRRILLASGTLTHAFGQSLADPEFAGLSSNADIAVLTSLHLSGPQRPRDLIDGAGLTTGGLSNLFDRLEQQQLIVRTYGRTDGDRRSALISLTANGTDLVDAIADAIRDTLTEQSALLQHLRDLIDSISDPTAPSPAPEPAPRPLEQLQRFARLGNDLADAMGDHDGVDEPAPVKATVVLCAAATTDGTRPRDLLELTDLSSGGITMLLDRLEEAGLIRRATGHAPDRRAVTITLTDLGRHDLHHRLERILPHLAQIRSAVTTPESPLGFAP